MIFCELVDAYKRDGKGKTGEEERRKKISSFFHSDKCIFGAKHAGCICCLTGVVQVRCLAGSLKKAGLNVRALSSTTA